MSIKRYGVVLFCFLFLLAMLSVKVYMLSVNNTNVAANAPSKRELSITISDNRGLIFDRNLVPMTGKNEIFLAVVDPQIVADTNSLFSFTSGITRESFDKSINNKKPFTLKLTTKYDAIGVNSFLINERYTEPHLATHTLGYLDANGDGVCGIEKSFNDLLKAEPLRAVFPVDAVRRAISGLGVEFTGSKTANSSGVMTTINSNFQKICDEAGFEYIKNGAIVMLDVKTAEILALSSMPQINPTSPQSSIDTNGAYINKCFTAYNVGSAFKICDTAVYLENGGSIYDEYLCEGYKKMKNVTIKCMKKGGHGNIDLTEAFKDSCNSYFIGISMNKGNSILELATRIGFGTSLDLAPNLSSKKGNLPTKKELESNIAVANFSIGQGSLLATPIQLASLVQTVANGGAYIKPSLILGETKDKKLLMLKEKNKAERLFSENTAQAIQNLMVDTIETGSAKIAKPNIYGAGAKTSTAQTGIKKDDSFINQGWVVGFFPAENPKYALAILSEDALGGGRSCGPAFKYIANEINKELYPK